MKMKYIRHSIDGFVLWNDMTPTFHKDMAVLVYDRVRLAARHKIGGRISSGAVVSAGFFVIEKGKACCFGRSESLDMEALPEDSELLSQQLGL